MVKDYSAYNDEHFISIVDEIGRTSCIEIVNEDVLVVVGVLKHNTEFAPKTVEDAEKLIDWLETFIENFGSDEEA